jgi:hypothetical protein
MKRALIGACAVAACLVGATAALAQGSAADEKSALSERLVTALEVEGVYRNMLGQASVGLADQAGLHPASPEQQQAAVQSLDDALAGVTGDSKPALIAAAAQVYSLDELKAAVAFFESPAGRAFNAKYPALEDAMNRSLQPTLIKLIGPWEADYCRRLACTDADHAAFAAMRTNLKTAPPGAPPQAQ